MIRWKYIISRVTIVAVVLVGVYLAINPVIRWSLITAGQTATGSRVEIGWVHSSLSSGRVQVEGIAIADPDKPMRNLLEADRAILDLDTHQLLRQKYVIEDGRLEGVRFNTSRDTSGRLPEVDDELAYWTRERADQAAELLAQWFTVAGQRLGQAALEQSETVQVAEELLERWPREYEQLRIEAQSIGTRIEQLRRFVEEFNQNPLRSVGNLDLVLRDAQSVATDIEGIRIRLDQLARRLPQDRDAIRQAQEIDRQRLRELSRIKPLDGERLSELAFGPSHGREVVELVEWILWLRTFIPNPERDWHPSRSRGVDVHFRTEAQPDFLIKNLRITGHGSWNDQRYDLSGTLRNLSTQPMLSGSPTFVELRAEGPRRLRLTAELDRTSGSPTDRIQIVCDQIRLPAQRLGREDGVCLSIDESTLGIECSFLLRGDRLDGEILARHRNIRLAVNGIEGGPVEGLSGSLLDRSLDEIDGFDLRIRLSGSLDRPDVKVDSDLGPRLASLLATTAERELKARLEHTLGQLDLLAQDKLDDLTLAVESERRGIDQALQNGTLEVSQIQRALNGRLQLGELRVPSELFRNR